MSFYNYLYLKTIPNTFSTTIKIKHYILTVVNSTKLVPKFLFMLLKLKCFRKHLINISGKFIKLQLSLIK